MKIFPVIMCGGAGTRLWPSSRPDRPKQFLNLAGPESLFQDTARRVAPLTAGGGTLVIVCGTEHRDSVTKQLSRINLSATVLLEPEARDSAPAMAAAAAWIAQRDPEGVAVYVASDHYLPDGEAFRTAVLEAAAAAQASNRILTLGVRPTDPSSAYGYIRPSGPGLSPIAEFVEKPTPEMASIYLNDGYLWNSGNFVVKASGLLGELDRHAPAVSGAARAAVGAAEGDGELRLGSAFHDAPKISIDYALMEKTTVAWVLPVSFEWSDLGAWDAVAAIGAAAGAQTIHEGGDKCYVRAPAGMMVATVGLSNIAVIVEPDAILVCDMSASQNVKAIVERLRIEAPGFLSRRTGGMEVGSNVEDLSAWLKIRALPLWSSIGMDDAGRFAESLEGDGRDRSAFQRARVPARQLYVFARAARKEWPGRWRSVLDLGIDRYWADFARPDGLVRALVSRTGEPLDDDPYLYDQAFALLALASVAEAGIQVDSCKVRAKTLVSALEGRRLAPGGWREVGDRPFQANAHMHLLEASLAWEELDPDGPWKAMVDEIVALAQERFIDRESGALHEFFTDDWTAPPAGETALVEPGHQFEWAWLLTRHGIRRKDRAALATAERLYGCGMRGVMDDAAVACDELNADLSFRSKRARLWPQTEWLKAALLLDEAGCDAADYAGDAVRARSAVASYLLADGRWRDKLLPDGTFVEEPAPASSFYHLMAAMEQLLAVGER